jgi:hypothetical protein
MNIEVIMTEENSNINKTIGVEERIDVLEERISKIEKELNSKNKIKSQKRLSPVIPTPSKQPRS